MHFPYAQAAAIPLLLLATLSGGGPQQTAPVAETQGPPEYQISVNVHLVVLHATVRDSKGRFVNGLHEADFTVYEDGVRQDVRLFRHEDTPVTVGLVVDHSGSMRSKIREVIAAARTFVQASSPEDEMFVVNFNEKVSLGLPDNLPLTNRIEDLGSAIANAPTAGMTALYDAVLEGRARLQTGNREKKVLMVISDGADNASKHTLAEVLSLAHQSNALIYTVGIFEDEAADKNPEVLRKLAAATGGEAYFPKEIKDVVSTCERIAHDIRNQYTIAYISNSAVRPGTFRNVRLAAAAAGFGKLSVRARAGYIAGGEPRTPNAERPK